MTQSIPHRGIFFSRRIETRSCSPDPSGVGKKRSISGANVKFRTPLFTSTALFRSLRRMIGIPCQA